MRTPGGCTVLALVLAFTALPAAAAASTVAVEDGELVYQASPGETNDLTIDYLPPSSPEMDPDKLRVTDGGAVITPGPGCQTIDEVVACAFPTSIGVDVADGDDRAWVMLFPGPLQNTTSGAIDGGTGNDDLLFDAEEGNAELYGGDGNDSLVMANEGNGLGIGGTGDDRISGLNPTGEDKKEYFGGPGNDTLRPGGDGLDILDGGPGADVFRGRPEILSGTAVVTYADRDGDVSVSLDGIANDGEEGEGDNVQPVAVDPDFGREVIDRVVTGAGDDTFEHPGEQPVTFDLGTGSDTLSFAQSDGPVTAEVPPTVENLIGSAFDDVLTGDAGPNRLDGGPGSDQLNGLGGDDRLLAVDGSPDTVDCGSGIDHVSADLRTDTLVKCERRSGSEPPGRN